jgi:hypothetical protein
MMSADGYSGLSVGMGRINTTLTGNTPLEAVLAAVAVQNPRSACVSS